MVQLFRYAFAFLCLFLGLSLISACAPTDENVFSYERRLASGKPIIYNRPGEQQVGCQYSWTDVRLSEKEIADLYFLGTLATASFGDNNCLTVGSEVRIRDAKTKEFLDGYVRVSEVIIWNGQAPQAREYQDYFKWTAPQFRGSEKSKKEIVSYASSLFNQAVMSKVQDSYDGVVNITHIHLVRPGSDANELAEKGRVNFESSFFEETTEDGQTLSSCGSRKFPDYRTTRETWELIQSGRTQTAWDVHPGLLCAGQGEIIQVVNFEEDDNGEREAFGKIKIGPMKRMRIEQFDPSFLKLTEKMTQEEAISEIEALYREKSSNPRARLFLFDFEVVP